jgi:hypothetical protein
VTTSIAGVVFEGMAVASCASALAAPKKVEARRYLSQSWGVLKTAKELGPGYGHGPTAKADRGPRLRERKVPATCTIERSLVAECS